MPQTTYSLHQPLRRYNLLVFNKKKQGRVITKKIIYFIDRKYHFFDHKKHVAYCKNDN